MSKRNKRKAKRARSRSGKNRSTIAEHSRNKGELLPPAAALVGMMTNSSWLDDRLPEMLWAVLIRSAVSQEHALALFRRLLTFISKHRTRSTLSDITLSGLAKLEEDLMREVVSFIIEPPEVARALACLRLFETLPARAVWDELLPDIPPDIDLLMVAVGAALWHQSQEATDCRWLRLMARVLSGRMQVPHNLLEEWLGYPNGGDPGAVRASIRAAEIAPTSLEPPDLRWSTAFWDEAWRKTPCLAMNDAHPQKVVIGSGTTIQRLREVQHFVAEHWELTHTTTAIDAKHDGVFGMVFYALRLLEELMGIGNGSGIIGRLGIRTILEVHVNLRYLLSVDNTELWKKWRSYGSGQAKLNALKFDDGLDPPKYLSVDTIERIAGEDIWEEFLPIGIASWSGTDLRKLSERVDLKSAYDAHYSWTSGYAHGTWGPIRESCFRTCDNPLHRLHRYPEHRELSDVIEEAVKLVDAVLGDLDAAFPAFPHRLVLRPRSL